MIKRGHDQGGQARRMECDDLIDLEDAAYDIRIELKETISELDEITTWIDEARRNGTV